MTTVREIIESHLKANGFDGLFLDNGENPCCRCRLGRLVECDGENFQHCQPGYLKHTGPGGFQYTITAKRERDADGEGPEDE